MNLGLYFALFCFIASGLSIFLTLFFLRSKKQDPKPQDDFLSTDLIIKILKSPLSDKTELYGKVDLFFEQYALLHPTDHQKREFLKAICLHKHTNAQIILKTQKQLDALNPHLQRHFDRIVKIRAGLNS